MVRAERFCIFVQTTHVMHEEVNKLQRSMTCSFVAALIKRFIFSLAIVCCLTNRATTASHHLHVTVDIIL